MPPISTVNNWKQIVAIIVSYAFVHITTSITPATAPYSFGSLLILGFLAYYIIRTQTVNRLQRLSENLTINIESLKEFKADVVNKRNNASDPKQKVYDQVIEAIDTRINILKQVLKKAQNIKE